MTPVRVWPLSLRLLAAAALGGVGAFGQAPHLYWGATVLALVLIVPIFLTSETRGRAA